MTATLHDVPTQDCSGEAAIDSLDALAELPLSPEFELGLSWARLTTESCLSELQSLTAPNGEAVTNPHNESPALRAKTGEHLGALTGLIRTLEELKATAQAAQAALAVQLDAGTRRREAIQRVPAARQGRAVARELGYARRASPWVGQRHLSLAKLLPAEMPHTWHAFRTGHIPEKVATALLQETADLTREARCEIDRTLAADPVALEHQSEKQIRRAAAALAARLDNAGVAQRRRRAVGTRRITISPAADGMSRLTLTVPLVQGVAAYASLKKEADALHGTAAAAGRGRGALMADAAITRLTGQADPHHIPVAINVVLSADDLVGATSSDAKTATGSALAEPRITEPGIGTFGLPAAAARDLVAQALDTNAGAWLRRLYAHPTSGQLIAMDSRSRVVPPALAKFITLRDQTCSTTWCDAPIRHIDHVRPVVAGGKTVAYNLQGTCEACNHAKQAPGWRQHAMTAPDGTVVITTRTPAGQHRATSPPPAT
ncbi:HNH endonuclease [Nocardioides daejeonensis]|uniref:HNH endonuclease n=1 Tax=Nocardioides daejeonensis TaxID=1046556 RepID=UPI000D74AA71|nr:DUF222 domain-containing protein [Nocardioides daejeonensis]